MGNINTCLTRDQVDYIKYDRYVYCNTCLVKSKYDELYVIAPGMNKTHMFCCRECYVRWAYENELSCC